MQTFLPVPDFNETAKILDYRRLGKQRVESFQLLNILTGKTEKKGWRNHPACLMWKGFEKALMYYHDCMIREWIKRGYNNNMKLYEVNDYELPPWHGDWEFHASHRSNLLRKDLEYYSKFGWVEPDNMEYVWPVKSDKKK